MTLSEYWDYTIKWGGGGGGGWKKNGGTGAGYDFYISAFTGNG